MIFTGERSQNVPTHPYDWYVSKVFRTTYDKSVNSAAVIRTGGQPEIIFVAFKIRYYCSVCPNLTKNYRNNILVHEYRRVSTRQTGHAGDTSVRDEISTKKKK